MRGGNRQPVRLIKASLAVLALTFVTAVIVFAAVRAAAGTEVSLPEKITASSVCPVAGCTSGDCHGADPVPELAAGETMTCPKVGCTAQDCHAADRLVSHYNEPKTSSLNVWILGLSAFTIAVAAVALYVR